MQIYAIQDGRTNRLISIDLEINTKVIKTALEETSEVRISRWGVDETRKIAEEAK